MIDQMSPHIVVKISSTKRVADMRRWLFEKKLTLGEDYEYYGKSTKDMIAFGFHERHKSIAFMFKLTFGGQ